MVSLGNRILKGPLLYPYVWAIVDQNVIMWYMIVNSFCLQGAYSLLWEKDTKVVTIQGADTTKCCVWYTEKANLEGDSPGQRQLLPALEPQNKWF